MSNLYGFEVKHATNNEVAAIAEITRAAFLKYCEAARISTDIDALNETFGRQMADSADIAILIGKRRAEPIARGLEKGGFDPDNLHVVSTLAESTALLETLVRPGDTVLYENDLPENYAD